MGRKCNDDITEKERSYSICILLHLMGTLIAYNFINKLQSAFVYQL